MDMKNNKQRKAGGMRTVKTWQGKTAAEIIAGRDGETNGHMYMTGDIIWLYRTDYLHDGTFDDMGPCASSADNADCITIESMDGILARLDVKS